MIEQASAVDAAFWASRWKLKLPNGCFTFENREYMIEPISAQCRKKCMIKGTQVGSSLSAQVIVYHGLIYGKYPNGVLYLMPTAEDVLDLSTTKFMPMIEGNPRAIGRFLSRGRGGSEKKTLLKFGSSFLYFRAGTLSRKIDVGYEESSKLKSITVDMVVYDEIDVMDTDIIAKCQGRMNESKVKEELYIGNPGVPGMGIDALFEESDQRHYWIKCRKCSAMTCAEIEFFENTSFIKMANNGTSYLGCRKCGTKLFVKDGRWVPQVPQRTKDMMGWRWSALILPNTQPHEVLRDYLNPPQGNLGDIMRTKLGRAFLSTERGLTKQQVLSCCGGRVMPLTHDGPCAMGVDVGDVKRVIIGGRQGQGADGHERYEVLKVVEVQSWDQIHELADKFHVKSAVIDINPLRDEARQFQAKARFRTFLCDYTETGAMSVTYNQAQGTVRVQRTEICDKSADVFRKKQVTLPRRSPVIEAFAAQVTEPKCVEEKDKRTGAVLRRYRGKNDHFRHAMNYFLMAADGGKVGVMSEYSISRQRRNATATVHYGWCG